MSNLKTCEWTACSNTFPIRNQRHRFCSTRCRVKSNRAKHGKPLIPSFKKSSGKRNTIASIGRVPAPVRQINTNLPQRTRQANRPLQVIRKGPLNSNYRTVLGVGILIFAKSKEYSTKDALIFGAGGYLFGRMIDEKKRTFYVPRLPAPVAPTRSITTATPNFLPDPSSNKILSAQQYRMADIPSIGFKGQYLYLMGDPAKDFYMLLSGMPGNGKSTFAIKFSQYYQDNHGKVLYLAAEQSGYNKPLQNLLKENSATFDINIEPTNKVTDIVEFCKGYDLVVIDSINNLRIQPDDLSRIKKELPNLGIVAIMQSTKDGKFKGSQEFLHDSDIHIVCEKPHAKQKKSRYAPPSEIMVFDEA